MPGRNYYYDNNSEYCNEHEPAHTCCKCVIPGMRRKDAERQARDAEIKEERKRSVREYLQIFSCKKELPRYQPRILRNPFRSSDGD